MPSRVHPGEFYALPQSPQIFKQILMIAGTDRYFQITRCFRDEDLRADRQPEFTQIDVEMSFATPDLVFGLIEPLMQRDLQGDRPSTIATPFRRMPYAEAIAKYGSDKPDLRCGLEIADLSEVFRESEFRVFKQIVAEGGAIRGFAVPGGNRYTRSQLDVLVDQAKQMGFSGLDLGPAGRAADSARSRRSARRVLSTALGASGATAGRPAAHGRRRRRTPSSKLLGQLRLAIAKKENLLSADALRVSLGHRLPAARVERRRAALVLDAPPVHVAADEDSASSRAIRQRARQGLRPGAQRQRDRRRQHPDPRRRAAVAALPAPRHQRRGGEAARSASSSRRSSTARRRTAASRSASTGSSRCWPGNPPSAR